MKRLTSERRVSTHFFDCALSSVDRRRFFSNPTGKRPPRAGPKRFPKTPVKHPETGHQGGHKSQFYNILAKAGQTGTDFRLSALLRCPRGDCLATRHVLVNVMVRCGIRAVRIARQDGAKATNAIWEAGIGLRREREFT